MTRFRAVLELNGKTATGFEVPAEAVAALGSAKRPAVRVTVNGYSYRTTVAPMGGRYLLPVSAQIREGAGIAAGDLLDVDLELDDEPREVAVPDDLALALAAHPGVRERFDALSYTRRKEHARSVEDAKSEQTRQRRIAKVVDSVIEST